MSKLSAQKKQSIQKKKTLERPAGPGETGWQAQKSAATRKQIIGAVIRCIVESSYSKTTIMKISEKAGMSRGATLHYFPSKMDIIRAAVDYLHEKRLQAFRRSIKDIPAGANVAHLVVQAYSAQLNHPIYVALFELSVAARTDKNSRKFWFLPNWRLIASGTKRPGIYSLSGTLIARPLTSP